MRRKIVFAVALASCFWGAAALAQDNTAVAAAPATTPDASAAPASGDDVIHLHMPVHRHAAHHASAGPAEPAESPSVDAIGADTTTSPAATAPEPASAETLSSPQAAPSAKATRPARPAVQKSAPAIPFTFGEDSGAPPPAAPSAPPGPSRAQATPHSRETKTASLPPKPVISVPAKPAREPGRAKDDVHAGLAKRGAVLFDKGVSNPSPSQFDGVKLLAGDLSAAVEAGRGPVQLDAYAGTPGDKSSDARRLSLRRAIAVRQLLIDNGVPSDRIVVRAMGGTDDNGPKDRVDVFVRAS